MRQSGKTEKTPQVALDKANAFQEKLKRKVDVLKKFVKSGLPEGYGGEDDLKLNSFSLLAFCRWDDKDYGVEKIGSTTLHSDELKPTIDNLLYELKTNVKRVERVDEFAELKRENAEYESFQKSLANQIQMTRDENEQLLRENKILKNQLKAAHRNLEEAGKVHSIVSGSKSDD